MSGHRRHLAFSTLRMGTAERLGLAALGCAVVWAGVFWAIG